MDAGDSGILERGAIVGPYTILEILGEGGMGVVYAAYDPRLDRRVALKLVRSDLGDETEDERARLLREAKAQAQLRHPNVVTVHEVGISGDDEVFLAMEFIEGATLRDWLEEEPRTRREILDVLLGAGEGLAAAHDIGLIHRDFKPENILVGDDGRAYVTDFGLARTSTIHPGDVDHGESAKGTDSGGFISPLTMVGTLVGTPAYMAPERLKNTQDIDAAADQFSFAVTLYEALYGERPFEGERLDRLMVNVTAGNVRSPPPGSGVPGWLRERLMKALAVEPDERFAGMPALIGALSADPTVQRRRWMIGIGAALLVAGGGFTTYEVTKFRHELCESPATVLAGVWDPAVETEIEAQFRTLGVSWPPLQRRLDEYATDWRAVHDQSCRMIVARRTRARGVKQLECLDRERRQISSLTTLFRNADERVGKYSLNAVLALRNPCGSAKTAGPIPTATPDAAVVNQILDSLAVAKTLHYAGKNTEARTELNRTMELTRDVHPELHAEALLVSGRIAQFTAGVSQGEADLRKCVALATSLGADELAAECEIRLVMIYALKQDRLELSRLAMERADGHVLRAGNPPWLRRNLLRTKALHHFAAQEWQKGWDAQEEALQFGIKDMDTWSLLFNQSIAAIYLDRFDGVSAKHTNDGVNFSYTHLGDSHHRTGAMEAQATRYYLVAGNYQKAIHHARAMGQFHRRHSTIDSGWPQISSGYLALAYVLDGDTEQAASTLASISYDESNAVIAHSYAVAAGLVADVKGEKAEAVRWMERAQRFRPAHESRIDGNHDTNFGRFTSGWSDLVLIRNGRIHPAKEAATLSIEKQGADHSISALSYAALGEAARLEGNETLSKAHFLKAKTLAPEPVERAIGLK